MLTYCGVREWGLGPMSHCAVHALCLLGVWWTFWGGVLFCMGVLFFGKGDALLSNFSLNACLPQYNRNFHRRTNIISIESETKC